MPEKNGAALSVAQEAALLALLRATAEGELLAEEARCRLCDVHDFEPYETFKLLQGVAWQTQKGWVSAHDFHTWLRDQPHSVQATPLEDVTAALRPYMNQHGEMRYDGFLHMCLPKDPARARLKDAALQRGTARAALTSALIARGVTSEWMPPEVAYRLCQVFESEKDLCSHLKFHQKGIKDLMLPKECVLSFLDAEEGICAGMGGFISPGGLRRVLVNRCQALSDAQCGALLRRINPSGACLIAFEDLARCTLLPPELDWGLAEWCSEASPAKRPTSPALDSTRFSTLTSQLQATGESPSRPGLDVGGDLWRSIAGASPAPTPRLAEPARSKAPQRANTPEAASRWDLSLRSPSTPMPPYAWGGGCSGHYSAKEQKSVSWDYDAPTPVTPRASSPASRGRRQASALVSPLVTASLDMSPTLRNRPRSPGRTRKAASLPPAGTRITDSLAAAARAARSVEAAKPSLLSSPLRDVPDPKKRSYFGGGHFAPPARAKSPSRRTATASVSPPPRSVSPYRVGKMRYGSLAWATSAREEFRQNVLQVMARQATSDSFAEEAKSLLPAGFSPISAFRTLDRFRRGYVTDSDLWQFVKDLGGSASLGSLCALTRELQGRRRREFPRAGPGGVPGELSLRDIAVLTLPPDAEEYQALGAVASDSEYKSVLYILRHSEPCPKCGMRVQRDADAAGCPSVTCPLCRSTFRCFCVVGDSFRADEETAPLSAAVRYQVYRVLNAAAQAALEIEQDRRKLALHPGYDTSALGDTFDFISGGPASFGPVELRRAFVHSGLPVPEFEMKLLWRRYAPRGWATITFTDFATQLKPWA